VVTYRNIRTGRIVTVDAPASIELMDAASKWLRIERETAFEDGSRDGIYHRGGSWFDVTVNGVTEKVQGRLNAEDRYGEMGGI
jgi:hypothetical protein